MKDAMRLLMIEDNPGDVVLVREALRECSLHADVTNAQDGEAALDCLNKGFEPDLIILDLSIPKLDGYRVLERIKPCSAPVVVFTSGTENTARALALGAREVVEKPSDFAAFVKAVSHIVETWVPRPTP